MWGAQPAAINEGGRCVYPVPIDSYVEDHGVWVDAFKRYSTIKESIWHTMRIYLYGRV